MINESNLITWHHNDLSRPGFEIFNFAQYLSQEYPRYQSCHQICLITKGSGQCIIDTHRVEWHNESIILLLGGQYVNFRPNSESHGYLIQICEHDILRPDSQGFPGLSTHLFDSQFSGILPLNPEKFRPLITFIELIKSELKSTSNPSHLCLLRGLFHLFLFKIEQLWPMQSQINRHTSYEHKLYLNFKQLLETDISTTRCVNDYADKLCITPKKLNQITRRYFGKTAKETINNRSILEMTRLLLHSDLSIKQIADRTGFTDPANMSRFFRQYTGRAPGDFKKSWGIHSSAFDKK